MNNEALEKSIERVRTALVFNMRSPTCSMAGYIIQANGAWNQVGKKLDNVQAIACNVLEVTPKEGRSLIDLQYWPEELSILYTLFDKSVNKAHIACFNARRWQRIMEIEQKWIKGLEKNKRLVSGDTGVYRYIKRSSR